MDTVVPGDDIPSALRRLLYLCTDFWYSNNGKKEAFTDDDGNKIELSVEALSNLPLSFINEATEAIWKACNENPTLKSG
jgi:hypothetical protein